jgi:probable phosphoglycerate mutase
MSRLWVVRHGETDWNRERRMQGHVDVPLNETGRDQARDTAERLAQRFADEAPPAIYTSDLRRAAQTALAIGRALQVRPHVARKLRERAFGLVEGKTFAELAESYPDEVRAYRREGKKDAIPGAEPYAEFVERCLRALRAIARREERAIVVTHGGLIKVVLRAVFGPNTQLMVANTALYTLEVDPEAEGDAGFERVLEEAAV